MKGVTDLVLKILALVLVLLLVAILPLCIYRDYGRITSGKVRELHQRSNSLSPGAREKTHYVTFSDGKSSRTVPVSAYAFDRIKFEDYVVLRAGILDKIGEPLEFENN